MRYQYFKQYYLSTFIVLLFVANAVGAIIGRSQTQSQLLGENEHRILASIEDRHTPFHQFPKEEREEEDYKEENEKEESKELENNENDAANLHPIHLGNGYKAQTPFFEIAQTHNSALRQCALLPKQNFQVLFCVFRC